ncbi:MAG: 4-hydroxy-tetrahydrodipicolinate synthase [Bdellovibrionales bacterium]|jgi:4-hydroxy-tetrahydrodipicolinate synthase
MSITLEGSFVALVTPFKDGEVDEKCIHKLTQWQIENGTRGIIACGTTGEAPTLSLEEQGLVIKTIVDASEKKIPVFAGTGSNDTKHVIEATKNAERNGADGALVVCPYYNRPTQNGLYHHYRAVAESTPLKIIVYNIQSRTAVNMETSTLERLAKDCPNIIGVKEASGSIDQMTQVVRACPKNFSMLSGDDNLTLPCMSIGGKGVISTVANIAPKQMSQLTQSVLTGNWDKARELHLKLFPLIKVLFIETNPGPIKEAMAMMKLIDSPDIRLPMFRMEDANRQRLAAVLKDFGLLN